MMPHMLNDEFSDMPELVDSNANKQYAFPGASGGFQQYTPTVEYNPSNTSHPQDQPFFPPSPPQTWTQPEAAPGWTQGQPNAAAHAWWTQGAPQTSAQPWPAYFSPSQQQYSQQSPQPQPFQPYGAPIMALSPMFLSPMPFPPTPYPSNPPTPYAYAPHTQRQTPASCPTSALALAPYSPPAQGPPAWERQLTRSLSESASSYSRSSRHTGRHLGDLITGRPPASWRTDFKPPRSGIAGLFQRRGISGGADLKLSDVSHCSIHPTLRFHARSPPLTYDLRLPTSTAHIHLHHLDRRLDPLDLAQYATLPPLPVMYVVHPKTPWIVTIRPDGDHHGTRCVTLYDVLKGLWHDMRRQIEKADLYNAVLGDGERVRIEVAYEERVTLTSFTPDLSSPRINGANDAADYGDERSKGVRRVDYLCRDFIFEGLVPGKKGLWEMRTRQVERD